MDLNTYRIRKIEWAVGEQVHAGKDIAFYRVQLYGEFWGITEE